MNAFTNIFFCKNNRGLSLIPLNKLKIHSPNHRIHITFFIQKNKPLFCLELESLADDNSSSKSISHGKNCPWLQKMT